MVFISVSEISVSNFRQSNIAIIGTIVFLCTSKLLGFYNFELCLYSSNIQANSTKLAKAPNLSNISSKYHEFVNIFSKSKAEVLTLYYSYDLKINLESAQPLVGPIYSLSTSEQETLKEFIKKNLNIGFIQPTLSLYGVLVLFVKKKDGSLHLCINFHGLNHISKKNHYPLPLISNLLDLSCKAWVYSKIDLYYIYHLVYITDGDE